MLSLEGTEVPAAGYLERWSHELALQWEIYSAPQAGSSEARSGKPKEGANWTGLEDGSRPLGGRVSS